MRLPEMSTSVVRSKHTAFCPVVAQLKGLEMAQDHCWWDSPVCLNNTLWVKCVTYVNGLPQYSSMAIGSCVS